ncbi:MAG: tyrosine-type recombinase/integrase, partial [Ketobacter sp.]|nr:tyrosine-type recombinase/integrase [Ketobacter sp.]
EQNATWHQLQPVFFLQLRANINDHPNTVNTILSGIRSFFQYLVRQGICDDNPLKDIPPLPERYFVPFVFSPAQTDLLLQTVGKTIRKSEKYLLFDMAIYLAFVMLARCGMRINEPLRLRQEHYRADEGSTYIQRTKFRKDRLIPVPKAVLTQTENYLAARRALCPEDQNPYLLAGKRLGPIKDYHIRNIFHRAIKNIGLSQPKQVIGNITFGKPLPHSLRHAFAINTLNQIKARGNCPQQALPILATYMGHRKYQYTAAYLKVKDAKDIAGLIAFTKSQLDVV